MRKSPLCGLALMLCLSDGLSPRIRAAARDERERSTLLCLCGVSDAAGTACAKTTRSNGRPLNRVALGPADRAGSSGALKGGGEVFEVVGDRTEGEQAAGGARQLGGGGSEFG